MKLQLLVAAVKKSSRELIEEMQIESDAILVSQGMPFGYEEMEHQGHRIRYFSMQERGVGLNRNTSLLRADGDICLFADDDVTYDDDMEERVLAEFNAHPDADVMIFHLDTDSQRKQIQYPKTKKCGPFARMPWGAVRIAFRLNSVRKANVWFTTLFGGGCIFPSGEDSMWLADAKRKGLTFYVSKETIGKISMEDSTWFTGRDEKYFFARGTYYATMHPKTQWLWHWYAALSVRANCSLSISEKMKWMKNGRDGYKRMQGYAVFVSK